MKKVIVFLAVLLIGSCFLYQTCFAGTKTLTFGWNQNLPSPNDLAGWGLYQSDTAGGPYTKVLDIPFVSPQSEYTAGKPITVPDGTTTTLYFVLDAVDLSGNRSPMSNEVSTTIDFQAPGVPIQLKVTVTTP